jgi:hypothetical protein
LVIAALVVSALVVSPLVVAALVVTAVLGLGVILLAVTLLGIGAAALLVVAALLLVVSVAGTAVASAFVASGRRTTGGPSVIGVVIAVSGLSAIAGRRLGRGRRRRSVLRLVVPRRRPGRGTGRRATGWPRWRTTEAATGRRTLLVLRRTLIGIASARTVLIALRRVSALVVPRRRRPGRRTTRRAWVFRTPVTVVVVLVAGPTLSLAAAVTRVVSHGCYSLFCVEWVVSVWLGRCGVGVDRSARAKLTCVQFRRLLESDNHITIRLPALILEVPFQVLGESIRC